MCEELRVDDSETRIDQFEAVVHAFERRLNVERAGQLDKASEAVEGLELG